MVSTGGNESRWRKYAKAARNGLILIFLFLFLKRKHGETSENGSQTAGVSDDPTKPKVPGHKYSHYSHPTEEEHRTAEQFNWCHSNALNVGIAIAAGITVIFAAGSFYETRREANIAQAALAQENRAWIDIEGDIPTMSFTWNTPNGPEISVKLTAANEGNSPAINVEVFPALFIWKSGDVVVRAAQVKHACWDDPSDIGNIVFVNGTYSQTVRTNISVGEINSYIKDWANFYLHVPVSQMPISLDVAFCAVYRIIGDDTLHQTIRVYEIGTAEISNGATVFAELKNGQTIPQGYVSLQSEFDGDYAN